MARYRSHAVFVGHVNEHKDFCRAFGSVDYYPTANYLELATVIDGSLLFGDWLKARANAKLAYDCK